MKTKMSKANSQTVSDHVSPKAATGTNRDTGEGTAKQFTLSEFIREHDEKSLHPETAEKMQKFFSTKTKKPIKEIDLVKADLAHRTKRFILANPKTESPLKKGALDNTPSPEHRTKTLKDLFDVNKSPKIYKQESDFEQRASVETLKTMQVSTQHRKTRSG